METSLLNIARKIGTTSLNRSAAGEDSRAPPSMSVQAAGLVVLMTIASNKSSKNLNMALDTLGMPKSTRSYHLRSLAKKQLITVYQDWHADYAHVRIYEYELTALGKIVVTAAEQAEQEIKKRKGVESYA